MARVAESTLRNWNNGETMNEADYEQEREILRTAINDNYDRLIKSYEIQDSVGNVKTTQNLDTAINYIKFREGNSISLVLDNTTSTLTIALASGSVDTADLSNLAVTTAKIADGNVTTIKLADLSVTTGKLADLSATRAKIANGAIDLSKVDTVSLDSRYYTETEVNAIEKGLQDQITANDGDISSLQDQITSNDGDITNLQTEDTNLQDQITSNDTDILDLYDRVNAVNNGTMQGLYESSTLPSNPSNGTLVLLTADYNGFKAGNAYVWNTVQTKWIPFLMANANTAKVTLSQGSNVLSTDQDSSLDIIGQDIGKTIVNHVPLFDSGLWVVSTNATVNSPTKITVDGAVNTNSTNVLFNAKENQSYTISLINGGKFIVDSFDSSDTFISRMVEESTTGQQARTFTTPTGTSKIKVYVLPPSTSTYVFENIMLNEGSAAQEFVANVQGLTNVYQKVVGKNTFNDKEKPSEKINNAVIDFLTNGFRVYNTTASTYSNVKFKMTLKGSQSYILSYDGLVTSGVKAVEVTDINNTGLGTSNGDSYSFTAPSDGVVKVVFYSTTGTSESGDVSYTNIQLEVGNTATTFEPYRESYQMLETTFHEGDSYYLDGQGNPNKLANKKEILLDGSFDCSFGGDLAGYKTVVISGLPIADSDYTNATSNLVKYDGSLLKSNSSTIKDGYILYDKGHSNEGKISISIADSDSGWTEAQNPNGAFISIYFNGWKYTGDGTTHSWESMYDSTLTTTSADVALNRNLHAENNKEGYKLIYTLADKEPTPITVIGDAIITEGTNTITLGQALIMRERATAYEGTYYQINLDTQPSSRLKYRNEKISNVYIGGKKFNDYYSYSSSAYGKERIDILKEDYNGTDVIEVDYLAIPYQLSANIDTLTVEYNKNINTQVNENTKDVSKALNEISILEKQKANREQMGFIRPTLLNGWIDQYSNKQVAYTKYDFNLVEIVGSAKNGTIGSTVFYLPKGYRPSRELLFSVQSYDGTTDVIATIQVNPDGRVVANRGSTTMVSFNFVFKAEK